MKLTQMLVQFCFHQLLHLSSSISIQFLIFYISVGLLSQWSFLVLLYSYFLQARCITWQTFIIDEDRSSQSKGIGRLYTITLVKQIFLALIISRSTSKAHRSKTKVNHEKQGRYFSELISFCQIIFISDPFNVFAKCIVSSFVLKDLQFLGDSKIKSSQYAKQSQLNIYLKLNKSKFRNIMTAQETKILRIQLYHPLIGLQNFDISSKDSFVDLKAMLSQHTQMTIFDNFRFQAYGKLLPELQEIGQAITTQTKINLVIQPFDQRSSYYHLQRVKQLLANPIEWAILNSRQTYQQKQLHNDKLSENITIDNFLQQQITSHLYQSESLYNKPISFLQQLNFSIHNPPPTHRRLAGDFYYLQVKTLEGHQQHVTASPSGFYINSSSNSSFSTQNSSGMSFYNLLDLFKYMSPKFKESLNSLKKVYKVTELDKAIFSSFKTPPVCHWLKSNEDIGQKKSKYNQWRHYIFDALNQNIAIKDWNQIVQINSLVQSDTQTQIINKQKNQYKFYQDFIAFAKDAAVKTVQCQILPQKFQTNLEKRVFNYGSVNIWIAEDDPMSYKTHENSKLTRRAINAEIRNLQQLSNSKNLNANCRHTVLVSYRGYSVVVQTIVPGMPKLEGLNKKEKSIRKDEKLIEQIGKLLKVEYKNLYKKDEVIKAGIHPEFIIEEPEGQKPYLLNLYSLSIPDLNFNNPNNNATFIRKQLIQIFNDKQFCYRNTNTMIQSGYNLIFNERIQQQHRKLLSLKTYAEQIMVPLCIQSFLRHNKKYLADSKNVVKVMHKFGLSSRYLGSIYKRCTDFDGEHIKIVIQRVILAKTLKNIIRQALRKAENGDIKTLIARIFNCIFFSQLINSSSQQCLTKDQTKDEISTNASRKKKKKYDQQDDSITIKVNSVAFSQIRPNQLWEQTKQAALFRYNFKFNETKISLVKCLQNYFGKSALLRDICLNLGIVLEKNQYFAKQNFMFRAQHIDQIKPLAKNISFNNKYIENLILQGDNFIERKRVEEAIDIFNQAINYATSNFSIMTQQLALLNKKVAEIYFRIGEIDAALLFINCAVKMYEKIYGQSYIETIQSYNLLSQFNFFLRNFEAAQLFLMKSIHISTVSFGQQYPELIISYLNLSTIYEAWGRYMDSITSISHALRIVLRIYGQSHLNSAICYAAMSTAHFEIPDIQKSIFFQQKSIQILKNILKGDDSRLKQAQKVLQFYVSLQASKKIKENYEKQKKKIIANSQLYNGFPLFRMQDYSPKERQTMYRKYHNFMQFTGKF